MKDNYVLLTFLHWIAAPVRRSAYAPAPAARNDGGGANDRYCEEDGGSRCRKALRTRPMRQSSARMLIKHKSKLFAFSLIELLISLIIISLITASFAPVISKKHIHGKLALSAKSTKIDCAEKYGVDCVMCSDKSCLWCTTYINVPNGQYVDPNLGCDRKQCKDKYGASCATCTKDWCTGCIEGYGYDSNNHTCTACTAPSYSPGGASVCKLCNNGYEYQDTNTAPNCKTCDTANGYFPQYDRKSCYLVTCPSGQKREGSSCTCCSSGYYQSNGSYSGTSCSYCGGTKQYSNSCASGCSYCGTGQVANSYHNGCVAKTCSPGQSLVGDDCISNESPAPSEPTPQPSPDCPDNQVKVGGVCKTKVTKEICESKFDGVWTGASCVTKRNLGYSAKSSSSKYSEIPVPSGAGVTAVKIGSKCGADPSSAKCCWYGTTGDSGVNTATSVSTPSSYTYSASKRTVCNYKAAYEICKNYSGGGATGQWRMPYSYGNWNSVVGSNGLQLCADESGNGLGACNVKMSACKYTDSLYGDCHASTIWINQNLAIVIRNGRVETSPNGNSYAARSVRCSIEYY